jgi:tRNA threonylcarbamoyl adenosine modification protein (Sua5/YciO/YrdC/YwlC family)
MSAAAVDAAVAALRRGELAVIPTDTVYGLAAAADRPEAVRRLYELKGRSSDQPSALVVGDLALLLELVPELAAHAGAEVARALLPGPYTLVLPNPARRFAWLAGSTPDAIGVRVPAVAGPAADVLAGAGAIAATSANLPGRPEPRRLAELAPELAAGCAALLDGGELPGTPSTVLDFTGAEPRVVREGAASSAEALQRVAEALA